MIFTAVNAMAKPLPIGPARLALGGLRNIAITQVRSCSLTQSNCIEREPVPPVNLG